MIFNNVNEANVEVVNDFEAQEEAYYLDSKISKKIKKRMSIFFKELEEVLVLTTLEKSIQTSLLDLIFDKLYHEVLYLIDARLKDNFVLSYLPSHEENGEIKTKNVLKKPIIAVGSDEFCKENLPHITISDLELDLAIESAMLVPVLLLSILNKRESDIIAKVLEYNNSKENEVQPSKATHANKIPGETEEFIHKLRSAIIHIRSNSEKLTKTNISKYLDTPRQTFDHQLKVHKIIFEKKNKQFVDLKTNTAI